MGYYSCVEGLKTGIGLYTGIRWDFAKSPILFLCGVHYKDSHSRIGVYETGIEWDRVPFLPHSIRDRMGLCFTQD